MKLPHGMTAPAIRLMQEFKRAKVETLTADEFAAIQHPGAIEANPSQMLVDKGLISLSDAGFELTELGKTFLERDPVPRE